MLFKWAQNWGKRKSFGGENGGAYTTMCLRITVLKMVKRWYSWVLLQVTKVKGEKRK